MRKLKAFLSLGGVAAAILSHCSLQAAPAETKDLVPLSFGEGRQPQITVTPAGIILVVFGANNAVYFVRSSDEGKTFTTPAKIAEVSGLMLGSRRGPRVSATNKRIVVSAPGAELQSFISEDVGETWSLPIPMNDVPTSASEGLDNLTALPDGGIFAVWLDSRKKPGNQVEGSRLEANARTWTTNVNIYESPDKSVCPCCHPSVASDGKNGLVVMWRNSLNGNRDLYRAGSTDRGDHFSVAAKIGTGSWPLQACPMDGGSIIGVAEAGIFAIWRRQNDIFLTTPTAPETKLGTGSQPVLARVHGQITSVWQEGANLVVKIGTSEAATAQIPGRYPALISAPDGKQAYLTWEGAEGGRIVPKFTVLR